jgi:hypothetical protein
MKRLFRSSMMSEVGLIRGLLEQAGIACLVRNERLSGALGDIPFLECEPELWVLNDADLPKAKRILAEHEAPATATSQWRCGHCGEIVDGQFGACWQCGTPDREI